MPSSHGCTYVASVSEPVAIGAVAPADPEPLTPRDVVEAVAAFVDDLVDDDASPAEPDDEDDEPDDDEDEVDEDD